MGRLVSPHTALPWGRGDAGKIAPLPFPTPMGTNSFLFLKGGSGTSPLGTWTSAEALIHGDRPRPRSAGTPGPPPEGPEPGHGLLQLPQPVPKSTCPLPDAPGRVKGMRPLLGPPHKVLGPRLPERYFCSWMDAEFLLLNGARDKGWLTLPSRSHCPPPKDCFTSGTTRSPLGHTGGSLVSVALSKFSHINAHRIPVPTGQQLHCVCDARCSLWAQRAP